MNTTQSARAVAIVAIVVGGVIGAGSLTSAAASTLASGRDQTTSRSVGVAGVDELDLDMSAGSMRIEFADVAEAQLTVTGGGSADQWELRRDGGELKVSSPHHHFWWWLGGIFRGDDSNGDAVLTLPQSLTGLDADLDSAAGELMAEGDFGDLSLSLGAGRIEVEGSAETVSTEISAGRADLQLADVRSAELELSAGDMEAVFTGTQPQRVRLTASAGSMRVVVPEGQYAVTQETSAGTFDNRIGSVPGAASTVRAEVSAGTITLTH